MSHKRPAKEISGTKDKVVLAYSGGLDFCNSCMAG